MSKTYDSVSVTDTFQVWLNRTNELSNAFSSTVTFEPEENVGNVNLEGNFTLIGSDPDTAILTSNEIRTDSIRINNGTDLNITPSVNFEGSISLYNPVAPAEKSSINIYQSASVGAPTLQWSLTSEDKLDSPNSELRLAGYTGGQVQCLIIVDKDQPTPLITGVNIILDNALLQNNLGDKTFGTLTAASLTSTGATSTDSLEVTNAITAGSMTINSGPLNVTGSITATDEITAFGSFSDINRKENIEKIENALDKVEALSGYTFNYIGDDRRITGVIAQEVEPVLPEVVYDTFDEKGNEVKAVRYANMMGLVIEAIKELRQEIENLKSKG